MLAQDTYLLILATAIIFVFQIKNLSIPTQSLNKKKIYKQNSKNL